MTQAPSWFQRILLPGLAFKAVVIGGGYATGRELVEFFMPSGPWGGVASIVFATVISSAVCVATFLFARNAQAFNYRTFFRRLLGPFACLFELTYFPYIVLVLAVFAAAAGAIGEAVFGLQKVYGSLCLIVGIAFFTACGGWAVEGLFKWVSIFLYATYAVFMIFALTHFGHRISASFAAPACANGWMLGGLTYASYNIIGAVVILPVVRHMTSSRDAVTAGVLAGPLAMLPALLFFICMCAFYPDIRAEALPSNYMLTQMNVPIFHFTFQMMIFAALLESGTGLVHAINERIASSYRARRDCELGHSARLGIASAVLVGSCFLANRFGLVTLIAKGYRMLAYAMLILYVLPLMTYSGWRLFRVSLSRTDVS
jgi:uncharacterized membrane protein YkvI